MSQLEAYYDEKPIEVKGKVEIHQAPLSMSAGMRSQEGIIRTSLVYIRVPSEAGPFLVPFGEYDEWSLRDRYNEAIRIMNTLGASEISCETFREVTVKRKLRARIRGVPGDGGSASLTQERVENSGFDFRHVGAGSEPRDPRPLRWPDEPGFAAAVSSVLENRATEIDINIKSSGTHSTEGMLGVRLKGLGFELGGGSEKTGVTHLRIHASFPRSKKGFR